MKERGILFTGEMVREVLADRKTQTRRLLKLRGADVVEEREPGRMWPWSPQHNGWVACRYGVPGDRLWVRETFAITNKDHPRVRTDFRADMTSWGRATDAETGREVLLFPERLFPDGRRRVERWTPGIHMPRWASRITLDVRGVRVERVQEISEADARAEGVANRAQYEHLWSEINGEASWKANPWVWAVDFARVR